MRPAEERELEVMYRSMTERQLTVLRSAFVGDRKRACGSNPCVQFATGRVHAIDHELTRRRLAARHRQQQAEAEAEKGVTT